MKVLLINQDTQINEIFEALQSKKRYAITLSHDVANLEVSRFDVVIIDEEFKYLLLTALLEFEGKIGYIYRYKQIDYESIDFYLKREFSSEEVIEVLSEFADEIYIKGESLPSAGVLDQADINEVNEILQEEPVTRFEEPSEPFDLESVGSEHYQSVELKEFLELLQNGSLNHFLDEYKVKIDIKIRKKKC